MECLETQLYATNPDLNSDAGEFQIDAVFRCRLTLKQVVLAGYNEQVQIELVFDTKRDDFYIDKLGLNEHGWDRMNEEDILKKDNNFLNTVVSKFKKEVKEIFEEKLSLKKVFFSKPLTKEK